MSNGVYTIKNTKGLPEPKDIINDAEDSWEDFEYNNTILEYEDNQVIESIIQSVREQDYYTK